MSHTNAHILHNKHVKIARAPKKRGERPTHKRGTLKANTLSAFTKAIADHYRLQPTQLYRRPSPRDTVHQQLYAGPRQILIHALRHYTSANVDVLAAKFHTDRKEIQLATVHIQTALKYEDQNVTAPYAAIIRKCRSAGVVTSCLHCGYEHATNYICQRCSRAQAIRPPTIQELG